MTRGTLHSPHQSPDIRFTTCQCMFKSHALCTSWITCYVCFHRLWRILTLLIEEFSTTAKCKSFLVRCIWISVFLLCFCFFNVQIEKADDKGTGACFGSENSLKVSYCRLNHGFLFTNSCCSNSCETKLMKANEADKERNEGCLIPSDRAPTSDQMRQGSPEVSWFFGFLVSRFLVLFLQGEGLSWSK